MIDLADFTEPPKEQMHYTLVPKLCVGDIGILSARLWCIVEKECWIT